MNISQRTTSKSSSHFPLLAPVLGALLVLTVGPAGAVPAFSATIPPLFSETAALSDAALLEQAARQERLIPGILRSRYVLVNPKVLEATGPIGLNLFSDVVLTATKNRLDRRSADRYSWFGGIDSSASGQAIFVFEKGVLVGDIRTHPRKYQVTYLGKGWHAIREIWELVNDIYAYEHDLVPVDVIDRPTVTVLLTPVVDVLVAYTPAATAAAGGTTAMEAQIQLAVDWVNQAYRNSRIRQVLRLAYAYEVPYTEATDIVVRSQQALAALSNPSDGVIDDVHRTRNMVGADLVSLWCFHGCGLGEFYTSQPDSVFSVVNWYQPDTFAHELGHNMGSDHERAAAVGAGAFPYSFGYADPNGAWHDIMSYGVSCGFSCPTIPYFSNPNVTYNGVPTGKPDGSVDANGNPDSADSARTLSETAPTIEAFRNAPAIIVLPATGGTLTCCQVTLTAQSRQNTEYFWMFGTGRNLADVIPWVPTGTTRSVTVNLPASVVGQTLWVRLYTRVGGPTGAWYFRDHTYSVQ